VQGPLDCPRFYVIRGIGFRLSWTRRKRFAHAIRTGSPIVFEPHATGDPSVGPSTVRFLSAVAVVTDFNSLNGTRQWQWSLNFASWNQLAQWMRSVDVTRQVA
jgi:hypothetical protein